MQVICTQENLKSGITLAGRIISSSSTLPILNNLLLKTENGLLKISSTNLEIAIVTHVRCKIEEEGEVTVVCKTLNDLIANLPNKNVVLKTKENQLEIEVEKYHTTIKTLPVDEFPLIPTVETKNSLTIDSQVLKNALDQVVFASAVNQTQPEITGVLFGFEKGLIRVVATDRYRLAEKRISGIECPFSQDVIIPHKTALEIVRIIGNQKNAVEISINETQISFLIGDTQLVSRLVDGQYPDYQQIIPNAFTTTVTVDRKQLISAIRTGGIFSQTSHSVKMEFSSEAQNLILSAESAELGKSVVEIACEVSGGQGELILNYGYVLDCLQNIDSEKVLIKIIDDNSPSLLVPDGQSDYIYLVMPIKS